jgi:ABC-type Zn2+ transport system substrate-binding protein/surface adhesin
MWSVTTVLATSTQNHHQHHTEHQHNSEHQHDTDHLDRYCPAAAAPTTLTARTTWTN